jgi:hypothetical protein
MVKYTKSNEFRDRKRIMERLNGKIREKPLVDKAIGVQLSENVLNKFGLRFEDISPVFVRK